MKLFNSGLIRRFMLSVPLMFFLFSCNMTVDPGTTKTDADYVAEAKSALEITYASGDSADKIRSDVTLLSTTGSEVTVTWITSDAKVITSAGVVKRPENDNASVTLTATLTKGSAKDSKEFVLSVYGTNRELADNVKDLLSIPSMLTNTVTSIEIPTAITGYSGVTVSWESSDSSVINAATGAVDTPDQTKSVTLTATINVGTISDKKVFIVTVYDAASTPTDADLVAAAKSVLEITCASGDSIDNVRNDITVPVSDANGVSISWSVEESKTNWLSISGTTGTVTRDLADIPTVVTAKLEKGTESDTKEFNLTITRLTSLTDKSNSNSIKTYVLDGNSITAQYTYTSDNSVYGYKYTYTSDTVNKTLVLTETGILWTDDPVWYTKETYNIKYKTFISDDFTIISLLKQKEEKTTFDIDDVTSLAKAIYNSAETDDAALNSFIIYYGVIKGYFGDSVTWSTTMAQFKTLDTAVLTAGYKKVAEYYRISCLDDCGLSYTATYDAILYALNNNGEAVADMWEGYVFNGSGLYSYTLEKQTDTDEYPEGYSLCIKSVYDSSKEWYEQKGCYAYTVKTGTRYFTTYCTIHPGYVYQFSSENIPYTLSSDYMSFHDEINNSTYALETNDADTVTFSNGTDSFSLAYTSKDIFGNVVYN